MKHLLLSWKLCLAWLLLLLRGFARADSWSFPAEVEVREFTHGSVRVVLTQDGRVNQKYPHFLFEVFDDGKRVAQVPGIGFDRLVASKDNTMFVGLSNSGIPGTAVVLFSKLGTIALLAQHGLAEFDYCSKSVTLERVWFDEESPNVRFQLEDTDPNPGIYLRDCRGQDVELLKTVQEAFARAAAPKKR